MRPRENKGTWESESQLLHITPEGFEHFLRLFPYLSNGDNYLYSVGSLPKSGEGKKLQGQEKSWGDGVGLQIARGPQMTLGALATA